MRLRASLKLPKEHGAWAMLYVPFAVGAVAARSLRASVLLLALSVSFVFIARESLLQWMRARSRGQTQDGARALLLLYLALAAVSGAPLILGYRLFWLVPFGIATIALLLFNARQAVRREDRTITGEMLAILGLTLTAPAAYYVGRGAWESKAVILWAVCILYFASSVFYLKLRVYAVNPRKQRARLFAWRTCAAYHLLLAAGLVGFVFFKGSLSLLAMAAFLPVLLRTFKYLARPTNQLNLKRIGLLEMSYALVFLVFISLTFRGA